MTKYIVPVSGGKDSQTVLSLSVKEFGTENVIALHNFTGIDHPLTMQHMKWMEDFYGVPIEHTSNAKYADMWDLIDKRNTIPGRNARFCTDELKIKAFNQWLDKRKDLDQLIVLMGMRAQESTPRLEKYGELSPDDEFSLCDLSTNKVPARFRLVRVRLPIVHRSTAWVFEYLRDAGERINPLYARGHKRVGCYPCILASISSFRLAARDPVGRETVIKLRDFKALLGGHPDRKHDPELLIPHDLDTILEKADYDPFGFNEADDEGDSGGGCQWCAI